jgi:glycerophosphoryl diester phosphodiesterase
MRTRFLVLVGSMATLFLTLAACRESHVPTKNQPAPAAPSAISRPRLVAHRGAQLEFPENTLGAFRRAWELGVECVELDMHVSKDDVVVIIHDKTTKRTAGMDRAVADQTLAELRALDAGRGEKIPTLAEVLDSIPAGRTLFLELKSSSATIPSVTRTIAANDPRPRGGKLALQAFDPDTLTALAKALPGVPAYWTVDPPVHDPSVPRPSGGGTENADHGDKRVLPYPREVIAEAKARGFAGLALDYRAVTDDFLVAAREAELLVDVWTINEPAELTRWLAKDVRWVETDRPDLVAARP